MNNNFLTVSKKEIEISPLPSIDNILKRLDFLRYSTQLRNLAYQIQLYEFLRGLHRNYKIDRGLENIYILQICYITSTIIEHMLFCSIKMKVARFNSRHKKLASLNNMAKHMGIIDKNLHAKIKKFISIRNDFHPEKQIELHVKKVNKEDLKESMIIINELGKNLRKYFYKL